MSDSVPQQRQAWEGGGGRDLPRKESDDTQIVAEILKEAGCVPPNCFGKRSRRKNPAPVAPKTLGGNKGGKTAS